MDLPLHLQALDRVALTAPVRHALGSTTVEVFDWTVSPLGAGFGNPSSLGLYRVTGHGQDRGVAVSWSLALKAIQSPANVGWVDAGEGEDPSHFNYWKRELFANQSALLDHLPGGLVAPRFFGAVEWPGEVVWLWLEVIEGFDRAPWPHSQYAVAARCLGHFSGAYLSAWALPTEGWLSKGFVRGG